MYRQLLHILLTLACVVFAVTGNSAEPAVYVKNARVQRPTRLDWVFAVRHESPAELPDSLQDRHPFVNQEYEFFGPRRRPARPLPLIIYISPGVSLNWDRWEPVCRKHGILFAGLHHISNRDVVEILGDVRRRYSIDPDRTYIVGFSAGSGLAGMTAFSLPEYFGGMISIGSLVQLPAERWLRDRVRQRLSIVSLCGSNESVGPLAEYVQQQEMASRKMNFRTMIVRGGVHRMPRAQQLEAAVRWLEQQLPQRRKLAEDYPATRIANTLPRKEWAAAVLDEAQLRLEKEDLAVGIPQLEGIAKRWKDLPEAETARQLLREYEAREERAWEDQWTAEEQLLRLATARGYDALANDRRPSIGKRHRASHASHAIVLWQRLIHASDDEGFVNDAQQRIAKLQDIAALADDLRPRRVDLEETKFQLVGTMRRGDALDRFKKTLESCGYDVSLPEGATSTGAADETVDYNLNKASFHRLKKAVLEPLGMVLHKAGRQVRVELANDTR